MDTLRKQKIGFTQVSNTILNDKNISFKAKGLYAYLYSKPDNWDFSGKRISNDSSEGSKSVYNGLKELEKYGYIKRKKLQTGRVVYTLLISPDPQLTKKPISQKGKQPKGQTAQRATISNKDSKVTKKDKNKERENAHTIPSSDDSEIEVSEKVLRKIAVVYKTVISSKTTSGKVLFEKKEKDAIRKALKVFTPKNLCVAIKGFEQEEDGWNMEHNGHRGMAWFFKDTDKITEWIGLFYKRSEQENTAFTKGLENFIEAN